MKILQIFIGAIMVLATLTGAFAVTVIDEKFDTTSTIDYPWVSKWVGNGCLNNNSIINTTEHSWQSSIQYDGGGTICSLVMNYTALIGEIENLTWNLTLRVYETSMDNHYRQIGICSLPDTNTDSGDDGCFLFWFWGGNFGLGEDFGTNDVSWSGSTINDQYSTLNFVFNRTHATISHAGTVYFDKEMNDPISDEKNLYFLMFHGSYFPLDTFKVTNITLTNNFFVSCDEEWTIHYSDSQCVDSSLNRTLYYIDEEMCNTTINLPLDNGTVSVVECHNRYTSGDLAPILGDGMGTAGASFVANIDLLLTMLAILGILTIVVIAMRRFK